MPQKLLCIHSVVSESLQPHGLQHTRLLCPPLSPRVCSHSCPSSWWCHPTVSSSVIPFSSCLQSFPASGSFSVSRLLASGGQSIGASALALVLPMRFQDWFLLGLIGLISLRFRGLIKIVTHELASSSLLWCLIEPISILGSNNNFSYKAKCWFRPHINYFNVTILATVLYLFLLN